MSTLHEMAKEVAERLDGETEFFLVVRAKQPEEKTGVKKSIMATNVSGDEAMKMAARGTTHVMMNKLKRKQRGYN